VRVYRVRLKPGVEISVLRGERRAGLKRWQLVAMAVVVLLVAGLITLAIWKYYTPSDPSPEEFQRRDPNRPSEKPEVSHRPYS